MQCNIHSLNIDQEIKLSGLIGTKITNGSFAAVHLSSPLKLANGIPALSQLQNRF